MRKKTSGVYIYQWGFRNHGETAADAYYSAFFDRFEQIAEQPLLYSSAETSAKVIEVVYAVWTPSIID